MRFDELSRNFGKKLTDAVKEYMKKFGVTAYDEKSGKGCVRHIYVRNSKNEALLTLVTAYEKLPHKEDLVRTVTEKCPFVCGIVQNVNPDKTNVVLGRQNITL